MNENHNQSPPDIDDVLSQLESMDDGSQPVEGQGYETPFPDTDEGKKQAAAFAKQRRLLQQAKSVIRSIKDKPVDQPLTPSPPSAPAGRGEASAQANAIMYQLQLEAIQNTGIADAQHPMVVLEMNRLYSEKVQNLRNRNEAGTKAPKVFETISVMPQYKRLTPEDLQEIQKRVKQLTPEAQADENTVKTMFSIFMGENIERFMTLPSGRQADAWDDSGAAASSEARSRGRGVPTGTPSGSGGATPPKPPDDKESREMRAIGLDPFTTGDVVRYRAASKRRTQFGTA